MRQCRNMWHARTEGCAKGWEGLNSVCEFREGFRGWQHLSFSMQRLVPREWLEALKGGCGRRLQTEVRATTGRGCLTVFVGSCDLSFSPFHFKSLMYSLIEARVKHELSVISIWLTATFSSSEKVIDWKGKSQAW